MNWRRVMHHLVASDLTVRRAFPAPALRAIEQAITESERGRHGEICFALEAALPLIPLLRAQSARERAIEVFSRLRIWDTERNSGILIYLLLADHDVEIVADRGIASRVSHSEWEAICHEMETAFRDGRFQEGALAAIQRTSELLAAHFCAVEKENELPDRPIVL
ncbi:MAG: TPM domain-containing protein [Burkholderiales bacterium]